MNNEKSEAATSFREIVNKWKPVLQMLLFASLTFGPINTQRLHAQKEVSGNVEYTQDNGKNERVAWALKSALEQFHQKVAGHNINKPHSFQDAGNQQFYSGDYELSGLFGQLFAKAFLEDSAAQNIPLYARDLELQKKYIDYYFAPASAESSTDGYFHSFNNRIWAKTNTSPDVFARILVHEIGHFFGLGEPLAVLFTEKLIGTKWPGISSQNWEYNPTFDRLLLEKVGEKKFWDAAFSTEKDYRNLWDKNMPVKYDHLLRAKSLNRIAVNAGAQDGSEPQYLGVRTKYTRLMLNKTDRDKHANLTPGRLFGCALEQFAAAVRANDSTGVARFQEFLYQQLDTARELGILDSSSRQGVKSPHIVSVFDDVTYRQIRRIALENMQAACTDREKDN